MADLIGHQLGQYEITALLGKGGMAAVYRARQVSMKRDVAVKVIESEQAQTSGFVKRFEREVETIASLSHAHILKVFDYGQHEGTVYLVMELLTGGSLADLIAKGPLPLDNAAKMLDQIASALDYAHRRGIIHRDLKPQNVMLDEDGNAFLSDFGIAKIMSGEQVATMTAAGAVMGTPAYMAPEQWKSEPVDARTDIYALGIILFEMLAGKLPFSADTAFGMMHKHVNEQPPVRSLGPNFPVGIERVLTVALAKNPEQRYSSAGEMSTAFKAALAGQPVPGPDSDAAFHEVVTLIEIPPDEATAQLPASQSAGQTQAAVPPSGAAPTLGSAAQTTSPAIPAPKARSPLPLLGALVVILLVGFVAVIGLKGGAAPTPTAVPSTTVPVVLLSSNTPTASPTATLTATVTPTLTSTASSTPTPTPTSTASVTPSVTLTPSETELPNAQTQVALTLAGRVTATALIEASYTKTPTPDSRATAAALLSALDTATAVQATANAVASFTRTPTVTPTLTPSRTPGFATALALVATQGNACTISTTQAKIEVHIGPGENRSVVRFLTPNEPVPVLDQALADDGSVWWRVDLTGLTDAWVAQTEVTPSAGCSGLPVAVKTTPTRTATAVSAASDVCAVSTSRANVEVHKGPGQGRVVLRFMPVNQAVKVLDKATADDGSLWWKVDLDNAADDWVAQSDVTASSACDQFVPPTPTPSPVASSSAACTVSTSKANIEVHKGAGENRTVLRFMPVNQAVPVIAQGTAEDKSLWWQVQLEGETEAWVAQSEVTASGPCSQTPMQTATPTVTPTGVAVSTMAFPNSLALAATATVTYCAVSTSSPKVEVHKGPGENRVVLRFMPVDQPVKVLDQAPADDKSLWWKVELEGLSEAWVPQSEVTATAACSQLPTSAPPTPTASISPAATVTATGASTGTPVAAAGTSDGCTVSASSAKIEVHKGPGENRAVLRFMPVDQPVKVLDQAAADDKSLWWKVELEGLSEAWVPQSEVTASAACSQFATPTATPTVTACTVSTSKANIEVHKGPSVNRAVLRFMPIDQPVKVLDQGAADDQSLWWKVELPDVGEAWVAQADVTASSACNQTPTLSPVTATPVLTGAACTVSTARADVGVHKGAGVNRVVLRFMPTGQPVSVIGQGAAADKSLWWEITLDGLAEGWVAQADVTASPGCAQTLIPTATPA